MNGKTISIKHLFICSAMCAGLTISSVSQADEIIRFSPGPDFTTKVDTPWGRYLIDDEGSTIWVGTESEYIDRKVMGISAAQGYKELKIEGTAPNTHYLISSKNPTVRFAGMQAADISSGICFDCQTEKDTPRRPPDSDYMWFYWVQTRAERLGMVIYDPAEKRAYRPYMCPHDTTDPNGGKCGFILPDQLLTKPIVTMFIVKGASPGALHVDSLAQMTFHSIKNGEDQMRSVMRGHPLSEDDRKQLSRLHALDASIPEDF